MTQMSFDLHTPSPDDLAQLQRGVDAYNRAFAEHMRFSEAFRVTNTDAFASYDVKQTAYQDTLNAWWALQSAKEHVREALHAAETGHPGHAVWTFTTLEDFLYVIARARRLLA